MALRWIACCALLPVVLAEDFVVPMTIALRGDGGGVNGTEVHLCMDLPGGNAQNGQKLWMWECNGMETQLWRFDDGSFNLRYGLDPKYCVDGGTMQQGFQLMLWECNGLDTQQFSYDPDAGSIYMISAQDASVCVDAGTPQQQGNFVQLWGCDHGLYAQQFHIMWGHTIRLGDNYTLCLDLQGGNAYNGVPVWVWDCNGLDNQQWIYDPSSGAIHYAADTSKCIDAPGTVSGAQLWIWDCNWQSSQIWGYDSGMRTLYLENSGDASLCLDLPGGDRSAATLLQVAQCSGCWNQEFIMGTWATEAMQAVQPSRARPLGAVLRDDCPDKPPPMGPRGPPCDAQGGWPKFDHWSQLHKDPKWSVYFKSVYGDLPTSGYPICVSDFWFLYEKELTAAGITPPSAAVDCPADATKASDGTLYKGGPMKDSLIPANTLALFHHPGAPYPSKTYPAFPDQSWVEVTHNADTSTPHGAWYYAVKGSGYWVNVGKTYAAAEHLEAWKFFGGATESENAQACVTKGYDSIQFLSHHDSWTCGTCCTKLTPQQTWNYELMMCKQVGTYACGGQSGDEGYKLLKAGWMGSRDCECDEKANAGFTNCKNVPMR